MTLAAAHPLHHLPSDGALIPARTTQGATWRTMHHPRRPGC